jgi:signal recognition particle subunit SEC65
MSTIINETDVVSLLNTAIKVAVSNWELQNTRLSGLLDKLTDEQLSAATAPGRNSGVYLLGHLTAVSDGMFTYLELGERLYPELDNIFVRNPETANLEKPSIIELKDAWNKVNTTLKQQMDKLLPADWFTKHSAVSAEDFEKEPHRNKLNILINRTIHQGYHLGQLVYLLQKASV